MVPRTKEAFDKWAEGFSNALQSREGAIPLDKDRMKVLFLCLQLDNLGEDLDTASLQELRKEFVWQLVESRSEYLELNITNTAKLFIADAFCNPADIVMILSALYWKKSKELIEVIDTATIVDLMPWGLPSEDTKKLHWDAQKVEREGFESDNLLDYIAILHKV